MAHNCSKSNNSKDVLCPC